MLVKAQGRFLRISPTKVRQVINLLRNKGALEAQSLLANLNKGPKGYLTKLLKQAVSTAKIKGFKPGDLYISKIICDSGPIWKRYKAAAFGRAMPIKKRTSHIRIELDTKL